MTSGATGGDIEETGCCPRFDPEPWRDRQVTWDKQLFVRDRVHSVLHIPIDFGKVMTRNVESLGDALEPDQMVLCKETSRWGTDVFLAVTRAVSGRDTATIGGTFLATVFEGPFRRMHEFTDQAIVAAARQGLKTDEVYCWYTTCPDCAKAYGENYIVIYVGSPSNSPRSNVPTV